MQGIHFPLYFIERKTMTTSRLLAATLGFALHLGAHAADFTVTSTDIAPGQTLAPAQIFQGFGCTGGNLSPQLSWRWLSGLACFKLIEPADVRCTRPTLQAGRPVRCG